MDIKMIAFDLDYTLLQTGGTLSDVTKKTLAQAAAQGILLVPATGRDICEMQPLLPLLDARYVVGVNGAVVRDLQADTVIYKELPEQNAFLKKLQLALSMGLYTEVYCDGVYTEPYSYNHMEELGMAPDQVPMFKATRTVVPDLYAVIRDMGCAEKLHILFRDADDKQKRQEPFLHHPAFAYTNAFVNNLELCSPKVSKASGLAALAQHLGIERENVMTLGDGANDAAMLRWAGLGVAMENAVEEAKAAADCVTLSNDADGAALAISKVLRGEL